MTALQTSPCRCGSRVLGCMSIQLSLSRRGAFRAGAAALHFSRPDTKASDMTTKTKKVSPIPPGYSSVTPYLTIKGAGAKSQDLIDGTLYQLPPSN